MNESNDSGTVVSRRWLLGAAGACTAQACAAAGVLLYDAAADGAGTAPAAAGARVPGGAPLSALGTSSPLHIGIAANVTLTGATAGSTITGSVAGMTLDGAARTLGGTPAVRSALLTEALGSMSRDTLIFAPSTAPRTMKLGINVAGLAFYSQNNAFLDHLKCAAVAQAPATADANGMPVTLVTNGWGQTQASYMVPLPDGRATPVKFCVITDGDMDFMVVGLPGNGYAGPGFSKKLAKDGADWVFTHDGAPAPLLTCYFAVTAVRRPATYMALVRDDEAALYRAGRTFRPGFIAALAGFSHVRFLNWTDANMADQVATPDTYITYANQDGSPRTVPLSVQAKLCKEAGIGGWFNFHVKATDAQYQAAWPLFDQLVGLGLSVRHELSNEIWNGQFAQYTWARDRARELGYGDNIYEAPVWYDGYRSAQLARLARGRGYKWQVGCQPVNASQAPRVFAGIAAAGGSVSDFHGWITTNYASGTLGHSPADLDPAQDAKQRQWVAASNYDAAFDNVLNGTAPNAYSVERVAQLNVQQAAIAKAHGLVCETYEGNIIHLNRLPNLASRPEYEVLFYGMANHPLAKPAMTVNLEATQAAGIACCTLFDFDSAPANSDWGVFGLYGRPAFEALKEWIANGGGVSAQSAATYRYFRVTPKNARNVAPDDYYYRVGSAEVVLKVGSAVIAPTGFAATSASRYSVNPPGRVCDGAIGGSYITDGGGAVQAGQFTIDTQPGAGCRPTSLDIYDCPEAPELSIAGCVVEVSQDGTSWATVADVSAMTYTGRFSNVPLTYPA